MSKLIMLVGLPGSGKSTFAKTILHGRRLTTDDFIESVAKDKGKTYNEVFLDYVKQAELFLQDTLDFSVVYPHFDIIWDQTNLTVKSRKGKLQKIPKNFKKSCIFFDTDFKKILERNEERKLTGRNLPDNVLLEMKDNLQVPTLEEGFDRVYVIKGD